MRRVALGVLVTLASSCTPKAETTPPSRCAELRVRTRSTPRWNAEVFFAPTDEGAWRIYASGDDFASSTVTFSRDGKTTFSHEGAALFDGVRPARVASSVAGSALGLLASDHDEGVLEVLFPDGRRETSSRLKLGGRTVELVADGPGAFVAYTEADLWWFEGASVVRHRALPPADASFTRDVLLVPTGRGYVVLHAYPDSGTLSVRWLDREGGLLERGELSWGGSVSDLSALGDHGEVLVMFDGGQDRVLARLGDAGRILMDPIALDWSALPPDARDPVSLAKLTLVAVDGDLLWATVERRFYRTSHGPYRARAGVVQLTSSGAVTTLAMFPGRSGSTYGPWLLTEEPGRIRGGYMRDTFGRRTATSPGHVRLFSAECTP